MIRNRRMVIICFGSMAAPSYLSVPNKD